MIIWSTEHSDNFTHNRLTGRGCASGTYGMQVDVISESGLEPLTLEEVKAEINVDYPDFDTVIERLIRSARQRAEKYMNRSLRPQTLKVSWEKTTGFVELPYTPVNAITTVLDKDGTAMEYETDHQGRISIPAGAIVTYTAGDWGLLGVPDSIKTGLLKDISSCFEFKENMIVGYSLQPIGFDMEYYYDGHSKNLWL